VGVLPRTRRRSIHASRNLSRAPLASLCDRLRRPWTEPACRQVRQLSGSGEGPGTGQGAAGLPETGREMATRTRASRCRPSYATASRVPAACPIGQHNGVIHGHSRVHGHTARPAFELTDTPGPEAFQAGTPTAAIGEQHQTCRTRGLAPPDPPCMAPVAPLFHPLPSYADAAGDPCTQSQMATAKADSTRGQGPNPGKVKIWLAIR
jgi:hypothetical protein